MGNYRLCGGSVLCCKLPENSDLILQIYSARRSIDLALFISFSRFMYICLYKADIIVYNYPVVLLRDDSNTGLELSDPLHWIVSFAAQHFFSTLTQ